MPKNMPGKLSVLLVVEGQEPFEGIMPEATALDLYKSVVGFGWHEPVQYPKSVKDGEGNDVIVNTQEEEDKVIASRPAPEEPEPTPLPSSEDNKTE